jgi:predicted nucleotidyltransferase
MNVPGRDLREWLERISHRLLEYDPEIVEVIQFGSSVYAPEHARDVDLLIITKNPRDYDSYLDAVEEVSPPFNVDIVVIGVGTKLREDFIRGVLGAFNIL